MKKVFIGLLIIAAGTATYFFLQKKKNTPGIASINKELLKGDWHLDSLAVSNDSSIYGFVALLMAMDSTSPKDIYRFKDSLLLTLQQGNPLKTDSLSYEWTNEKEMIWKDQEADSTVEKMTVIKLDQTDLIVRAKDSTVIYFKKMK